MPVGTWENARIALSQELVVLALHCRRLRKERKSTDFKWVCPKDPQNWRLTIPPTDMSPVGRYLED